MEQRLFTKTMNLHNKVSNLCWLTWVWVRKSVQNPVHFLVRVCNLSPPHMCVVSHPSKKHKENFESFIPKISQFQTGPPVSPPGTTISGRATGFPHLFSKVLTSCTDNTAGHGFPNLLHIKPTFPGSTVTAFHGQLYPMKGPKWHTQLRRWGTAAAPSWKALNFHCSHQKVYQLFIIKCFPISYMALVNFQGPNRVVVDSFVQCYRLVWEGEDSTLSSTSKHQSRTINPQNSCMR